MSFMSNECGGTLSISQKFRQSAQELKSVRTLTGVSMLLAMSIVISFVGSVRLTETLKIGLGYLITALLVCCTDRLQQRLQQEPETSSSICSNRTERISLVYPDSDVGRNGVWMFLVPGKMHHLSCDCIQELNFVAAQLLLEHLLDFPLYGMPFLGALGPRVIKNVVALPFEIILLYIVLNGMSRW